MLSVLYGITGFIAHPEHVPGYQRTQQRHSKIAVTMEIYTEAPSDATRDALRKLGDWLA